MKFVVTLREEASKQSVVPVDEVYPEKQEDNTVRTASEVGIANLDKSRIKTEEEEQYLDYNTMDEDNRDNATNEESAASAGVDKADYSTDFDLRVSNLADVFNKLVDTAEENAMLYQVNVPKKLYDNLFGIFKRMSNGDKFIDVFFRHSTNTEANADGRNASGVDKTSIRQAHILPNIFARFWKRIPISMSAAVDKTALASS